MTQMISKTTVAGKRRGGIDPIAFFERFGVLIFMILLLIFFQMQNSNFLSERNIFNILTEVSIYGIMAVGMTFVILTAGIDLSVGSILAVCAMTAAYVIKGDNFTTVDPGAWGGMSWLIGLGICLAMGTAIGFLHGLGVTRLRLPPFIVTLGGMTIWRGLTLVINDGAPIAGFDGGAESCSVFLFLSGFSPSWRWRATWRCTKPAGDVSSTPSAATRRRRGWRASTLSGCWLASTC